MRCEVVSNETEQPNEPNEELGMGFMWLFVEKRGTETLQGTPLYGAATSSASSSQQVKRPNIASCPEGSWGGGKKRATRHRREQTSLSGASQTHTNPEEVGGWGEGGCSINLRLPTSRAVHVKNTSTTSAKKNKSEMMISQSFERGYTWVPTAMERKKENLYECCVFCSYCVFCRIFIRLPLFKPSILPSLFLWSMQMQRHSRAEAAQRKKEAVKASKEHGVGQSKPYGGAEAGSEDGRKGRGGPSANLFFICLASFMLGGGCVCAQLRPFHLPTSSRAKSGWWTTRDGHSVSNHHRSAYNERVDR